MKVYKNRYLEKYLKRDIKEKILILTGPRQSGKTMLSKHLYPSSIDYGYFNYFDPVDRLVLERKEWNRNCKYLVFDELHIKKNWKRWLKALYEKTGLNPGIIVTGSARLETYRRSGDSLAGCFFPFRLHPLDLKEINQINKKVKPEQILNHLLEVGGFPEPYFKGTKQFYNRWKKTHSEAILKEDMLELDKYHRISQLETLLELLKSRVGQTVQYENFSKTLQCDGKTVKKMLDLLEGFYFIFKVSPYYKNINKSIRKQPKYYFYDIAQIQDKGARFENLVACALLKQNHLKEDGYGETRGLYYLRNKDKKEIDFLLTKNSVPFQMIETKWKEDKLSSHFDLFAKDLPASIKKIQLVKELVREKTTSAGHEIRRASSWLQSMD
ncbi:MAG: ATP-binding protein [Bdellovibrionales bacterium]|nr:ATP-binding protein [Bdellovibrionales bacterium]